MENNKSTVQTPNIIDLSTLLTHFINAMVNVDTNANAIIQPIDLSPDQELNAIIDKYTVVVNTKSYPLSDYIAKKNIDLENIRLLFTHIQTRNQYLTRFYNKSLSPLPLSMKNETPMISGEMNNNKLVNYKNIIRNMHWRNILKNTKSGMPNNPTFMDVLENLYSNNQIDYKILTPSAMFYTKQNRIGSVFSSYYFRASIMNPYLVYSLNRVCLNATRVFTPTLGWTSYSYGFLESPSVVEYVGTDVIPSVCNITRDFCASNYPDKTIDIYCVPSEDLLLDGVFMGKYTAHFDTVFFSPPYYCLELYEGENQSTNKYRSYGEWLEKYWRKTVELCHTLLLLGGKLCYILSGYGSLIQKGKTKSFDLIKDMNSITTEYFGDPVEIQNLYNKNVHVTTHRETAEKIITFIKH